MKTVISTFEQWGNEIPVYSSTLVFGEYTINNRSKWLTPFGRKLLKFIWCDYRTTYIEYSSPHPDRLYYTAYRCIPGTIPSFFMRTNDRPKTRIH